MDGKGWAFDPALYGYSDVLPHYCSALRGEETKHHKESLSSVQLSHSSWYKGLCMLRAGE